MVIYLATKPHAATDEEEVTTACKLVRFSIARGVRYFLRSLRGKCLSRTTKPVIVQTQRNYATQMTAASEQHANVQENYRYEAGPLDGGLSSQGREHGPARRNACATKSSRAHQRKRRPISQDKSNAQLQLLILPYAPQNMLQISITYESAIPGSLPCKLRVYFP